MPLVLALLFVTSLLSVVEGSACGPQRKCQCSSDGEMDCTSTNVHLKLICAELSNQTYKLRAQNNGYQTVRKNDLEGCEGLKSLFIGNNNISLPENCTFCDLKKLEELDLSHNYLYLYQTQTRPETQFPEQLSALRLNGNMENTPANATHYPDISYLTRLRELHLDGFPDQSFPSTYKKMKTLLKIHLSGQNGYCNIPNITNETFRNLDHVRNLNISACNVKRIEAGAFENMNELEVLDISENIQLGFRVLANVTYGLQFTNIKSFNVSRIYSAFGMGTKLQKQDICYLYNTSIQELVLNDNRMEMIETNAPILVPETLRILRVEENKFVFGVYMLQLGCISNMTEFYIGHQFSPHNPLLFYQQSHGDNTDEMYIFRNTCPYMTEEFLYEEGTRRNYCQYYKPENISSKLFPMLPESLRRVSLASSAQWYNLFVFVELPMNNKIEYLDLSGNAITALRKPLDNLPNLKHLDLSKNYCFYIVSNFFSKGTSLTDLQLNQNLLGLLLANGSKVFSNLRPVQTLNLSSNIISDIPRDTFSGMVALRTLDLSINNIDKWTLDVNGLDNLLYLDLRTNFLQTIPKDLRQKLEENSNRLETPFSIDLRNNSITTSCDNRPFLEWMVKHRENFVAFHEMLFQDSSRTAISADLLVDKVLKLRAACASYALEIVLGTIGVSVFLIIVLGGVMYRNRWKLRYLIRLTKIRYFNYKRLQNHLPERNYRYDVFISYANENYQFVVNMLVPRLEHRGLHACLHDRDFLPGNNIADNIINAIRNSRTTLIVLSPDFLKSKWCLYEFNMARMESIYSRAGSNCLLFILYQDVYRENMPTEMLEWICTNTYLEYTTDDHGGQIFWQNLHEVLRV